MAATRDLRTKVMSTSLVRAGVLAIGGDHRMFAKAYRPRVQAQLQRPSRAVRQAYSRRGASEATTPPLVMGAARQLAASFGPGQRRLIQAT